ncbi:MAG: Stp1/IreP family PP2C-type Ser/Thr phosphatase [bacterium]
MRIQGFGITDIGLKRRLNEDHYICDNERNIYVVADGMGGVEGGELASKMAAEVFLARIQPLLWDEEVTLPCEIEAGEDFHSSLIKYAIEEANEAVYQFGIQDASRKGMGTTFTAAIPVGDRLYVGHIGDSRVYRYRDGVVEQLSEDHTLVQQMVREGKLSPQEARRHPKKNVITRSLGPKKGVIPDLFSEHLAPGDIYLLCSDGLYGMVEDGQLVNGFHLSNGNGLEDLGRQLIAMANEGGGKDNITVVLFTVEA